MKIINDSSILDVKPLQVITGCYPHRKVLRHIPEDKITPYVIHMENLEFDGDSFVHLDFHAGHYFRDLESAKLAFSESSR
jgi:hypothetical protein